MAEIDMNFSPRIMIGSAVRLGDEAASRGDRALIVADSLLDDAASNVQQQLDSKGIHAIIFAREGLSCDTETLDEALSLSRGSRSVMTVSLGGEKVMSLGRLVAAYTPSRSYAADAMNGLRALNPGVPLIEIPVSGRHSLLFRKEAFLSDSVTRRTVLVSYDSPPSHTVILDASLSRGLVRRRTELAAALRLAGAVEAYLSPRSTYFSEVQARSAVTEAVSLLRQVRDEADHPDYRAREVESALLSGFSAAFSGPGPAQALAWASAASAGVSQAASFAVLFPWALESPVYAGSPKAGSLTRLLAGDDEVPSGDPVEEVRSLFGRLGLPGRLREIGADLADLLPAASWAAAMGHPTRADFSETAFRDILELAC